MTMKTIEKFNSLVELTTYFDTEAKCKHFLKEQRWGDVVVCPYCGCTHCCQCKDGRFKCEGCKNKFNVTVGTIFENTKIGLRKWFIAMYLISSHKKGISSCQLARDLHITQKTAWYILQKVRTLYAQNDEKALVGDVEMDEMYLGGRETNKHESKKVEHTQGRSLKTKSPIFGMTERHGNVVALHVEDTKAKTLKPIIMQFVADNAHIFTDENNSYCSLASEGYIHSIINHGAKEFANGSITTNSIEGFWAHFKRSIFGIYHFVSKAHLQDYIDEMVYRWNTRKSSESERFADMFKSYIGIVRYDDVKRVERA